MVYLGKSREVDLNSSAEVSSIRTSSTLPNPLSFIEFKRLRFIVMDAPSENNIETYVNELHRLNVTDVVRLCDPTYRKEAVETRGIRLHDMIFSDGDSPPVVVLNSWLKLVSEVFYEKDEKSASDPCPRIAVHCVAGLGRAPVLVAIALIEEGMSALDAVTFIRSRRRGAINNKQLRYLEGYGRGSRCVLF